MQTITNSIGAKTPKQDSSCRRKNIPLLIPDMPSAENYCAVVKNKLIQIWLYKFGPLNHGITKFIIWVHFDLDELKIITAAKCNCWHWISRSRL